MGQFFLNVTLFEFSFMLRLLLLSIIIIIMMPIIITTLAFAILHIPYWKSVIFPAHCFRVPALISASLPSTHPRCYHISIFSWLILIKMHMLTSAPDSLLLSPSFMPSSFLPPPFSLSLSRSHFPRSVLRGWGQWRMAQVAMTTPGASTARTASMEAASSCVFSSSCPSTMTRVPATCSCFAGENS